VFASIRGPLLLTERHPSMIRVIRLKYLFSSGTLAYLDLKVACMRPLILVCMEESLNTPSDERSCESSLGHQFFANATDELRRLAQVIFSDSASQKTLQPTALVNEAWLKLAGKLNGVNDRHHFFALAAKAMRQVLADHARGQSRDKRGGGRKRLTLGPGSIADAMSEFDAVEFNDALEHLASLNQRHAQVAELRLLGAMSIADVAVHLGTSEATVVRDWRMAKLWLIRELG
jgi:RNA polymerase sigma factor (TIGR02999 family)